MAYGISIPGRSVASNYAASFRPVGVVPGFSQVKSDLVANYLMKVPMLRQQMEMDLAKQALAEAGAMKRTKLNLDAKLELAESRDKANKLLALAQMSGDGGSSGGSSLLGPLSTLNDADSLFGSLEARDRAREGVISNDIAQRITNATQQTGGTKFIQNLGKGASVAPVQLPEKVEPPAAITIDINDLLRQTFKIEE